MAAHAARPRIEGAREEEILAAAIEILVETGLERLTMDAVAARAKASKASLYRRWSSKNDLVVDAIVRAKSVAERPPHDTGSLRGDLLATFCGSDGIATGTTGHVLGSVITTLLTDHEFADEFRARFVAPKLATSRIVYERAQQRGELVDGLDLDLLAPALPGILLHRMFVLGETVNDEVVASVIDQLILPAVLAHGRPPTRSHT